MQFIRLFLCIVLALPAQFVLAAENEAAQASTGKIDPATVVANIGDFHSLIKLMSIGAAEEDKKFLGELLQGENFKLPKMQYSKSTVKVDGFKNAIDFSDFGKSLTLKVAGHKFVYDRSLNLQKNIERFAKFIEQIEPKSAHNHGFSLFREAWADDRADALREAGMDDPAAKGKEISKKASKTAFGFLVSVVAGAAIGALVGGLITATAPVTVPLGLAMMIGGFIGAAFYAKPAHADEISPEALICPTKDHNTIQFRTFMPDGKYGTYEATLGGGLNGTPVSISGKVSGHETLRLELDKDWKTRAVQFPKKADDAAKFNYLGSSFAHMRAVCQKGPTEVQKFNQSIQATLSGLAKGRALKNGTTVAAPAPGTQAK